MEACSQACLKGSQTAGLEQAVWEECFEELVGGQGLVAGSFDGEEDYQVLECWSALVVVDVEQDCWVFVCYLAFFGEVAFVAFRFEQRGGLWSLPGGEGGGMCSGLLLIF